MRGDLEFGIAHASPTRMQPPASAFFSGRVPKQPVARAVRRLDAVVIADQMRFRITDPPFAVNALRPIGAHDAMTHVAPHKETRRMIGERRDGLNLFGT